MAYAGYGGYAAYGYGYGTPSGGAPGGGDFNDGTYNPRYHYAAAQNAGFELTTPEDGESRTLYVGNLHATVTEDLLCTLFAQVGVVSKVKVIYDASTDPYAFVEFYDHASAEQAMVTFNRRMLLEKEMKVNWATQPGTSQKVDTSRHYHVFVGDLSPEVDNKTLQDAFAPFGSISEVKIIRDTQTQKSKGYGFVSYPRREDAERAIEQMNGQWLGRRTIRTNWATRKPVEGGGHSGGGSISSGGGMGGGSGIPAGLAGGHHSRPSFDELMYQTSADNTSVYVGNLPPASTEEDIRTTFSRFGTIVDVRHFKQQGYSFVKFERKDQACRAILEMNGHDFGGHALKCSWGKAGDGSTSARTQAVDQYPAGFPGMSSHGAAAAGQSYDPQAAAQFYQYYQYYFQQQQHNSAAGGARQ